MGSIYSEFIKLKRSMSWAVVVLLPVMAVFAGSMSTIAAEEQFENGWHTLWIRSIGFYGMAILPVGIAILASLVWRVEHKNGNWNALMSRPVSSLQVVIGKVAAVAVLSAVMQVVLLVTAIALGEFVFGLPGTLPAKYFVGSVVVMMACVPVAAPAIGAIDADALVRRADCRSVRGCRHLDNGASDRHQGCVCGALCPGDSGHPTRHLFGGGRCNEL